MIRKTMIQTVVCDSCKIEKNTRDETQTSTNRWFNNGWLNYGEIHLCPNCSNSALRQIFEKDYRNEASLQEFIGNIT